MESKVKQLVEAMEQRKNEAEHAFGHHHHGPRGARQILDDHEEVNQPLNREDNVGFGSSVSRRLIDEDMRTGHASKDDDDVRSMSSRGSSMKRNDSVIGQHIHQSPL